MNATLVGVRQTDWLYVRKWAAHCLPVSLILTEINKFLHFFLSNGQNPLRARTGRSCSPSGGSGSRPRNTGR